MIEKGFAYLLLHDAAVRDLARGRVYPVKVPEAGGLPAVTYSRSGTDRASYFLGAANPVKAVLDVTCWADSYAAAKDLAGRVSAAAPPGGNDRNLGDGYRGWWGPARDVFVQKTDVNADADSYAPPVDDSAVGVHSVALTVTIWYDET